MKRASVILTGMIPKIPSAQERNLVGWVCVVDDGELHAAQVPVENVPISTHMSNQYFGRFGFCFWSDE